jgi:large subunit ribosomal protein L4
MIDYKIYNQQGETVGDIKLSVKVFGQKLNQALVHQVVVTQLANERQVLAHTKDRSEVRGGGKKPWRQKGTGRARVGSSRSPIWIGGGVTFGPTKDRNFSKKLNLKMKQKALQIVLSDKVVNKTLVIINELVLTDYKTKEFKKIIDVFKDKALVKDNGGLLIIDAKLAETAKASGRNLPKVKLINLDNINIVDLLKYKNLVMTQTAVEQLEKRYQ